MSGLEADELAIIRKDDAAMTREQKLQDPSRVWWDRHCLLAHVDIVTRERNEARAEVKRLRRGIANILEYERKGYVDVIMTELQALLDGVVTANVCGAGPGPAAATAPDPSPDQSQQ